MNAGPFGINSATGQITVADGRLLDYETARRYDLTVQVSDGALTASSSVTISVTDVNDAPTAVNNNAAINEDSTYTFKTDDFGFSDQDAGDTLQKIQITAIPLRGRLLLSGATLSINQEIPASRIPLLTFTPEANANGAGYAGFQFKVHDGKACSAAAYTMTINVTAVNDPPSIDPVANQSMDIRQTSISVPIKVGDIDTDPNNLLVSAVSSDRGLVPNAGLSLQKGGVDPLDPGKITWTLTAAPAPGRWGDAAIAVTVSDGTAAASTSLTLTVLNTPVCDPQACSGGVQVTPAPGVTVTFDAITAAGETTASTSPVDGMTLTCPGAESFLPGLNILGQCYDIHTTAAFTGNVEICLTYDAAGLTLDQEQALTLGHMEAGVWRDRTIRPVDTVNKVICGSVSEFSWFAIAYDKTPPTLQLNRLKDRLWPVNHEMVKAATVTKVADTSDPSPKVDIRVTSNEPVNGKGSGKDGQDWEVRKFGDTWEVWVRAERSGKSTDRIYTINATVTDKSGNQATGSHTVRVPHDQR